MENKATVHERRFNQRYDAAALKVDVLPIKWFGITTKKHNGIAKNFSLGGVSIVSEHKLKVDQKVLVSLGCDSHRLQAIPMLVSRCVEKNNEYDISLQFNLGDLPNAARNAAFSVLKSIENELKQSLAA